mmetsp:Transcript_10622/g.14231  ORF Transcript_10622/g.14231 Transcript_10622/m.14231 type:complete len:84 (+) Transcript_10622:301-552(+)
MILQSMEWKWGVDQFETTVQKCKKKIFEILQIEYEKEFDHLISLVALHTVVLQLALIDLLPCVVGRQPFAMLLLFRRMGVVVN